MKVWKNLEREGQRLVRWRQMGVDERDETWGRCCGSHDRDEGRKRLARRKEKTEIANLKASFMDGSW